MKASSEREYFEGTREAGEGRSDRVLAPAEREGAVYWMEVGCGGRWEQERRLDCSYTVQ